MTDTRRVSVVVPAYNAAAFLGETLGSIRRADPEAEIIVVDDASTDDTRRIAQTAGPSVRCITIPSSGGNPGHVRNVGFAASSGEYLASIDADDVMTPGRIRSQVDFLRRHPQVAVAFSDYQNFRGETVESSTHFQRCPDLARLLSQNSAVVLTPERATRLLLTQNYSSPSTMMMRRSIYLEFGGYSADLQTSEDFHYFFRLSRQYVTGVIAELGCMRRYHASNLTGNGALMLRGYKRSRLQLLESEQDPVNRRLIHAFLFSAQKELSKLSTDSGASWDGIRDALGMLPHLNPRSLQDYASASRALLRACIRGLRGPRT